MSAWRHHRTTGLHWPSERLTQHSQALLLVHFLLFLFRLWRLHATEPDPGTPRQSLSHWLWNTTLSVGKKRERTNIDEDKMTVKAPEQCIVFSYIYTAKGNWLYSRQKHRLSAQTLCLIAEWSPVLRNGDCSSFISSRELERQMGEIHGRLSSDLESKLYRITEKSFLCWPLYVLAV